MARAHGGDGDGIAVAQVIEYGEVVGRQVPHHVDVALHQAEIDAHGIEVQHVADVAAGDHFLHAAHGGGVQEGVVHHQEFALFFGQLHQVQNFGGAARQRSSG